MRTAQPLAGDEVAVLSDELVAAIGAQMQVTLRLHSQAGSNEALYGELAD